MFVYTCTRQREQQQQQKHETTQCMRQEKCERQRGWIVGQFCGHLPC